MVMHMNSVIKAVPWKWAQILVTIGVVVCSSPAHAADAVSETGGAEIGIEVGALTIIGADLRLSYRETDSPYQFGIRYLNIKDDFINETSVGFPGDESDKVYTRRTGVYVNYLFSNSFYLAGAFYNTTTELECGPDSDSESKAGIYFGGGLQGRWTDRFGYNVGLLISPMAGSDLNTTNCSSESDADFDVHVSLFYLF